MLLIFKKEGENSWKQFNSKDIEKKQKHIILFFYAVYDN